MTSRPSTRTFRRPASLGRPSGSRRARTTLRTAVVALADLVEIQDSTTDLRKNPTLQAAAAQAPNCQSLKASG